MYDQIIYNSALTKLQEGGMPNAKALATLMVAQAKHETANFTSPVFKNNNNAFGYKYFAGSSYQLGRGTGAPKSEGSTPYAKYTNVGQSAREVAAWILRRKKSFIGVTNYVQYASKLKEHGYYGATFQVYVNGLKNWYKEIVPGIPGGSMSLLALCAAGLTWFILK